MVNLGGSLRGSARSVENKDTKLPTATPSPNMKPRITLDRKISPKLSATGVERWDIMLKTVPRKM